MSRIEVRGIIVGSDYDNDWMQDYIEKGILTPESYFRRLLGEANPDEPLTVYLNTPGGSVFAGNEMVNAAIAWKQASKQPLHVEVGAMAASMGASFTVQAADTVAVHPNSLMMFHGAWGLQIGGAEAMADYADLLGKVNARDKTVLLTRYKLQPEQVETWFAEGREGWLNAEEMKAAGIATEVIGEAAEPLTLDGIDVEDFAAHGLKVAALVTGLAELNAGDESGGGSAGEDESGENDQDDGAGEGAGEGANDGDGNDAGDGDTGAGVDNPPSGEDGGDDGSGEPPPEPSAERIAGREEGRGAALAEYGARVTELEAKITNLETIHAKVQSERDKALATIKRIKAEHEVSLTEMSEQLRVANERASKLLDGSLAFSSGPATWTEALEACGGEYDVAAKQYPELRDAFIAEHRTGLKG